MVADLVGLVSSFVLNAAIPYAIVNWDLSRLSATELERAWPEASFLSAVFFFGPLSLPFHFVKTRRSLLGLCLGVGVGAGAVLCASLPAAALGWLLGDG